MRTGLKVWGVVAALAASDSASAADLAARMYTKAEPLVRVYNWTGFYVGGHVGGGWSNTTLTAADAAALAATYGGTPEPKGIIGGAQLGYNYQVSNVVLGVEVSGGAGPGFRDRVSIPGVSSLRTEGEYYFMAGARLGYAVDRWLPYFTGGGAWAGNRADAVTPAGTGVFKNDHTGFFVGGGLEYAVTNNVSLGMEYRYLDLDRRRYGGVVTGSEINTISARANYRF